MNIVVDNVNSALYYGVGLLQRYGVPMDSRDGDTLEAPWPVVTTYRHPLQRVLYLPERDANPFFHVMEALWILEGKGDVASLAWYNKQMAEYGEPDGTFHAPYGKRLRGHFEDHPNRTPESMDAFMADESGHVDQLAEAVRMLRANQFDRRIVLQIWDCTRDLRHQCKDIPCNDLVFLRARNGKLDATVCCRSNDIIWGAYGANAVQFSFILEWLASASGLEVGSQHQVSNSFHAYTTRPHYHRCVEQVGKHGAGFPFGNAKAYEEAFGPHFPIMIHGHAAWDRDNKAFWMDPEFDGFVEPWFRDVALPMRAAWNCYKQGDLMRADKVCDMILAGDLRAACKQWIARRIAAKLAKTSGETDSE